MKRVRVFWILMSYVVGVTAVTVAQAQKPPQSAASAESAPAPSLVIGEPITQGNLSIFPVCSKTRRSDDRFITLDEGLKAGTVEIYEKGAAPLANEPGRANSRGNQPAARDPFADSNAVNTVMVVNRSERPLYLMPGEIIIGGDQDRTVGKELVIAPSKTPVPIDVFCVEHGRWGRRDRSEYEGNLSAAAATPARANSVAINGGRTTAAQAAGEAARGKFIGSVGSLNRSARMAVQKGAGQQKVWDEVGKENAKSGVKSTSGAFTGNYAESEAVQKLDPYLARLHGPIAGTENVVGVIVAVNGKVESMDVFESTPLFKKLWPKLLKSYALDAANARGEAKAKRPCTRADAIAFLGEVIKAEATKTESAGGVAVSHRESDRVLLFSAHEQRDRRSGGPAAAAGAGRGFGGMGGMGGAIHSSGFAR